MNNVSLNKKEARYIFGAVSLFFEVTFIVKKSEESIDYILDKLK